MATNYREGDYVPGKGVLTPYGTYRAPKETDNVGTANRDLFKLFNAGVFNKTPARGNRTPAPVGRLANSIDGVPFRNDEQGALSGNLGAESQRNAERALNPGRSVPKLSRQEAVGVAKDYGLQGLVKSSEFEGLTRAEAFDKALQIRNDKKAQTSALTSYSYNPQSINNFRSKFKEMQLQVEGMSKDSWTTPGAKKNNKESVLNSFTDQLAGSFTSLKDFQDAQQDPEMQSILKEYEKMGGSRNNIACSVGGVQVVSETENRDGSFNVKYSDGISDNRRYVNNADGTQTSVPAQTIEDYLGKITTPGQKKAMDSLIPENQIAQDQIANEMQIPQQYRDAYFGTPEQIGFLEREAIQKREGIKLLERKAKIDETSARGKAGYLSQKADLEMQESQATVEKNRLAAKNYMTGQLAKLGALNTTGAAPLAIATLEQKYQEQSQRLTSTYQLEKRNIDINMKDKIANIDLDRDTDILKVKEDLNNSEEDVWKKIFELEISAKRKSLATVNTFAGKYRTQTDKYTNELKREAEKYAKELAKKAGSYNMASISGLSEGQISILRNKSGKIVDSKVALPTGSMDLRERIEASTGEDGYVNSALYTEMFNEFVNAGGKRQEFISQYPPKNYINPEDTSLPSFLRYKTQSQTEKAVKDTGRSIE